MNIDMKSREYELKELEDEFFGFVLDDWDETGWGSGGGVYRTFAIPDNCRMGEVLGKIMALRYPPPPKSLEQRTEEFVEAVARDEPQLVGALSSLLSEWKQRLEEKENP